ncbi:TIGR02587 family membrane protein [Paracoccus beibuensis]|uniref:TIGR02587 family membrane protein n=1 Tax=Paracoccus beibuensis TaxID=547602 RepID=UPI0022406AC4|nr:TIGR02587 family membrane protein [Paracoccus beibuensis]
MTAATSTDLQHSVPDTRKFCAGLGRAFAGALLFSLPMLMTMEMWWLGFTLEPWRISVMLLAMLPLLMGLSRFGGFRRTDRFRDDLADVLVSVLVAAVASTVILFLFSVITTDMPSRQVVGKIAMQMFPASIGAMLARSQMGDTSESDREESEPSYLGELFLMGAGALYLSLNVAPTEEMVLIAFKMSVWQEIGLLVLSLTLMHALVYSVGFRGGTARGGRSFIHVFGRFTCVGYVIVALVSLTVLWLFGRTGASSTEEVLSTVIVLSFPGAIGGAVARLVL